MAFLDSQRFPVTGEVEVASFQPPDTLIAIDQLEFGIAAGRIATGLQMEGEVFRQAHVEGLAGDHIADTAFKFEIHAHATAFVAAVLGDFQACAR